MSQIDRMVLGFFFDEDFEIVVMIRKNRPAWQQGKFNAPGGHIEESETPHEAVRREFKEETGVNIPKIRWKLFASLSGPGWLVECFCAQGSPNEFLEIRSETDEKIMICPVASLDCDIIIPNVRWLVPMAIDSLTNPYCPENVSVRYGS